MKAEIEAIVGAFAPEMERIAGLNESKEGKVRIAENWLRQSLKRFEDEVRTNCAMNHA